MDRTLLLLVNPTDKEWAERRRGRARGTPEFSAFVTPGGENEGSHFCFHSRNSFVLLASPLHVEQYTHNTQTIRSGTTAKSESKAVQGRGCEIVRYFASPAEAADS